MSYRDTSYAKLEQYIKAGDWSAADYQTERIIFSELRKEDDVWLKSDKPLSIPCEPLKIVNELWVEHSDGRFGFSVQKEIYRECGGILDGYVHSEALSRLCETAGWQTGQRSMPPSYNMPASDTPAPRGHLPYSWAISWLSDDYIDDYRASLYKYMTCVVHRERISTLLSHPSI